MSAEGRELRASGLADFFTIFLDRVLFRKNGRKGDKYVDKDRNTLTIISDIDEDKSEYIQTDSGGKITGRGIKTRR